MYIVIDCCHSGYGEKWAKWELLNHRASPAHNIKKLIIINWSKWTCARVLQARLWTWKVINFNMDFIQLQENKSNIVLTFTRAVLCKLHKQRCIKFICSTAQSQVSSILSMPLTPPGKHNSCREILNSDRRHQNASPISYSGWPVRRSQCRLPPMINHPWQRIPRSSSSYLS